MRASRDTKCRHRTEECTIQISQSTKRVNIHNFTSRRQSLSDKAVHPHLHIGLDDDIACGRNATHIAASSRKHHHIGHPAASTAGSSAYACRTYNAFRPGTGTSGKPHCLDGSCGRPVDARKPSVSRTGSGRVGPSFRMVMEAGERSARSDNSLPQRWLPGMCRMDPCGTAPRSNVDRISAAFRIDVCRYAQLRSHLPPVAALNPKDAASASHA